MEQNREDLPVRILEALKAELMEAGTDSDRLVNALEKFEKSIDREIIPVIKNRISLPYEIEKMVLETELANQKRHVCFQTLIIIGNLLGSMRICIKNAEQEYFSNLKELESRQ